MAGDKATDVKKVEEQVGKRAASLFGSSGSETEGNAKEIQLGSSAETESETEAESRQKELKRLPWSTMLKKLVEWKEQKSAWPKTLSKDSHERALAKWLSNQRSYMKSMEAGTDPKRLKGMTDERIQILDTRVPGWRGTWKAKKRFSSKTPWEESLQKAVEWRERHPNRWPTLSSGEEEEKVYLWLVEQRRYLRNMLKGNTTKLGGMTPARAARLDMELGDAWFRGNKGPEGEVKKKTSKKKKKKTTTILDIEGDEKEEEKEEEEEEEEGGRRRKRRGT
ncbi:hypothetical protein M9435_000253 [Picochlorum sp. BPE23]|nr:hypothetical protein M9435_000253 [Picochlorum sp. BPE23]